MDEAEKYKQRLEAIAEKRRQQEEQDKARREMEDEKLRLQQLKRKSLRDQWLMEGPPLSPTSPDAQSPRSPLWGAQAQDMEKHNDKLQSEAQRLTEEREKLTEAGRTEAVKVAEAGAETANQSPAKTAVVLTNGGGALEANANHGASEQNNKSTTNGPIRAVEGFGMKLEPALGVTEAEPGRVPYVNINEEEEEEEEEGTLVMRAECVIITDEGDDGPEDLTSQEDHQEPGQSDSTPLLNPEAGKEKVEKRETAPETFTELEKNEAAELATEAQPAPGDGDMEGTIKANEAKAEVQDKQLEDPASVQLHPPVNALEGTTVALVPVYSEEQPSTLSSKLEAEGATSAAPEGAEPALKAQDPACLPGQFQEVPLADPQESQRTEAGPGEQEPLLLEVRAPNTKAEPAGANSPASTATQSPTRASQGEETEAPKHKNCQCCSVM